MIPEREREALMRLTMCAREECGMCKYKDTCDFDFQYETATRCMNTLADALCKTESNSEKPNNCTDCECTDDCTECKEAEHGCKDEAQTEVKGSERLLKGSEKPNNCKDEPQKWEAPPRFEHKGAVTSCVSVPAWAVVDEPQTERSE